MSTPDPSSTATNNARAKRPVASTLNDPRLRPSFRSPDAHDTFLRRLARIRASQPPVTKPGRIARASSIISNITIPLVLLYSIFLVDWGPHEHVFSGPQRWYKRQKDAFWSVPEEPKPTSDELRV